MVTGQFKITYGRETYGCQWGAGGAVCGTNWEIGINTHTLLIICTKSTTNENTMYSTGNSIH